MKNKANTFFAPIRRWWFRRKFAQAKRALGVMIARKDPEIYKELTECAAEIAKRMCMRWLDDRRIQHCHVCPNTAPLIKLTGIYYCAPHAGMIAQTKKNEAEQKEPVSA